MDEPNNSQMDIFENRPPPKPEELSSDLSASIIPPAQKPQATPVSWSLQCANKKLASDYEKDRVNNYAELFKDGEILTILELVEAVEPKIMSFVVTDLRNRRLAGIKKKLLRKYQRLQKSQVGISVEEASLPGMFCFHQKRLLRNWPVVISTHVSSGFKRSIVDEGKLRSPYVTSRCNLVGTSSPPI